jgi:hypothetical protein
MRRFMPVDTAAAALGGGCVKTQRCDWTAEYSSVVAFCRAGLFRFNGSLGRTQQIIAPNRYAGAFLHSLGGEQTFTPSRHKISPVIAGAQFKNSAADRGR